MRKALAILSLAALGACTTAQQQQAAGNLAKLQSTIANGCMVVQPTLAAVAAIDPVVAAAAAANGLFCATVGAITVTSAQSLVSTGIPAIEQAVTASTMIPPNVKPVAVAALGVLQLTAMNALSVYGQPVTAPVSVSAPVVAPAASQ